MPDTLPCLHGFRFSTTLLAVTGTGADASNRDRQLDRNPRDVIYAPLESCLHYASHCQERLLVYLLKHPRASATTVLGWLRQADECTRTRVMELVRAEPKRTIGEAFPLALAECAHEWTIPRDSDNRHSPPQRPQYPTKEAHTPPNRGRRPSHNTPPPRGLPPTNLSRPDTTLRTRADNETARNNTPRTAQRL